MTAGKPGWGRRGFLGAALVGVGAVAGAAVRKWQEHSRHPSAAGAKLDSRFTYDTSGFEKTDSRLLLGREEGGWATELRKVRRLRMSADGGVYVAGDRSVVKFLPDGSRENSFDFDRPTHALAELISGELLVAFANHFEIAGTGGTRRMKSQQLGANAFVTSAAVHGSSVFLADAGNREVIECDLETGRVLNRFGHPDQTLKNPGLVVPSPYFDLFVSGEGELHVVNPGRLRVETYDLQGRYRSHWGLAGMQIERFCGCCNPVFIAPGPGGTILTSEKGLVRVKSYSAEGKLLGVIAGHETLVDDPILAKKACSDCSVGAGFDIQQSRDGRVFVLDPFRGSVRIFGKRLVA